MRTEIKNVNRLPAITWYWLQMNETEKRIEDAGEAVSPDITVPASIRHTQQAEDPFAEQPTGAGADAVRWIEEESPYTDLFTLEEGKQEETPVVLRFCYPEKTRQTNVVSLDVKKNSCMTVIMDLRSAEAASGVAGLCTRFRVEEGACLRLFQILHPDARLALVNDIGGTCVGNGRAEIKHLFLTSGHVMQGCRVDLPGKEGALSTDIAYLVKGEGDLDMNYVVEHTGAKTNCDIRVNGVLRDHARKIFRGTIDFVRGAAGAVGNEIENVLMMDETVRNQTIPLILCAEEDVVGNHGATIGRLDEQLLFYLESRGMKKEEIYEMIAKARIDALVQQIPDEAIRAAL